MADKSVTVWLTPKQVAQSIGMGITYVRRLIKDGILPAYKVSSRGDVRLDAAEIDRFIRSRRVTEELGTSGLVRLKNGSTLTSREVQLMELVAAGKTNVQIGVLLGISDQTVKNHMTTIMRVMGASNRTEAAVMFVQEGHETNHRS